VLKDFLLYLIMLRKKAVMKELKSAGGAPSVSHLLFADDSLILIRAKNDGSRTLHTYKKFWIYMSIVPDR
jgi:hypothetical protein